MHLVGPRSDEYWEVIGEKILPWMDCLVHSRPSTRRVQSVPVPEPVGSLARLDSSAEGVPGARADSEPNDFLCRCSDSSPIFAAWLEGALLFAIRPSLSRLQINRVLIRASAEL